MTIGEKLRKTREKKKITLGQVSGETKIRVEILEHFEEDKFSEVLNLTYVKGFLKKYAEFLGLNSKEIIEDYMNLSPPPVKQMLILPGISIPAGARAWTFPAAVILLIIVVAVLTYKLSSSRWPGPAPAHKEQEIAESIARTSAGAPKPAPAKRLVLKGDVLKLAMKSKEDCWVQARADGRVIFQDIVRAGEKVDIEANEKFELHIGKAHVLELELNGIPLGSPGRGVIRNVVVTRKGIVK